MSEMRNEMVGTGLDVAAARAWVLERLGDSVDPDAAPVAGAGVGLELVAIQTGEPDPVALEDVFGPDLPRDLMAMLRDEGVQGGVEHVTQTLLPVAGVVEYVAPLARQARVLEDGTLLVRPLGAQVLDGRWVFGERECRVRQVGLDGAVESLDGQMLLVADDDGQVLVLRPATAGSPSGAALAAFDAFLAGVSLEDELAWESLEF